MNNNHDNNVNRFVFRDKNKELLACNNSALLDKFHSIVNDERCVVIRMTMALYRCSMIINTR